MKRTETRQVVRALPARIAMRPNAGDWTDDELMTLAEAAALFWPHGPLSTASLRTAHKKGELAVAEIAGKFLTTKQAIADMARGRMVKRGPKIPSDFPATASNPHKTNLTAQIEAALHGRQGFRQNP